MLHIHYQSGSIIFYGKRRGRLIEFKVRKVEATSAVKYVTKKNGREPYLLRQKTTSVTHCMRFINIC